MDIIERLRDAGDHARFEPSLHHEAADEIERMREAFKKIKKYHKKFQEENEDKWHSGGVPFPIIAIVNEILWEEK